MKSFILLIFLAFGVCGAAPALGGLLPSPGFPGDFPGGGFPLAAVTMEWWQVAIAGAMSLVVLIGYHFKVGDYIRQQASQKTSTETMIGNQPVRVQAEVEMVERAELSEALTHYASRDDLHKLERHMDEKLQKSVGAVHQHLRGMGESIEEKIATSAEASRQSEEKLHEKVNGIALCVAEMRGEMKKKGHA